MSLIPCYRFPVVILPISMLTDCFLNRYWSWVSADRPGEGWTVLGSEVVDPNEIFNEWYRYVLRDTFALPVNLNNPYMLRSTHLGLFEALMEEMRPLESLIYQNGHYLRQSVPGDFNMCHLQFVHPHSVVVTFD